MSKLIAPAEFYLYGWGCETKPFVKFRCEPLGGGAFLSMVVRERGREQEENVLLDEMELDTLLVALTDPDFAGREAPADFSWLNSAVGQVNIRVPLDTGLLDCMIQAPRRLIALADFLIALTERAGIPLPPSFHPMGSR